MKPTKPDAKTGAAATPSAKAAGAKTATAKASVAKVAAHRVSSDLVLGAGGCCLAAASAAFGIGMTMHGPDASLGTSKDFTVFAQMTHHGDRPTMAAAKLSTHGSAKKPAEDDLDMTSTASIPAIPSTAAVGADVGGTVLASARVEAADADTATIWVDGGSRIVRVGDSVPGAGTVLEIESGGKPLVRTSRGLIVSSAATP